MLTTTRSFSTAAARTRLRWPAWRAPMVGTSPTESPSRRQPATRSRSSAVVATTSGRLLATAVLDLWVGLSDDLERARVAVLGVRENALGHLRGIAAGSLDHLLPEVRVGLDEARLAAGGQAQQVVDDEHLAVAARSGADPDGGDGQGRGDLAGERRGDTLEHDAERPRRFQLTGVLEDPGGDLGVLALDLEAAQPVHALRRQTDVAHDRDSGLGQPAGRLDRGRPAALQLHRVHPRLLEQAAAVVDRLLDRGLVGEEGQVTDQQGVARAARHGPAEHDQLVHRDR